MRARLLAMLTAVALLVPTAAVVVAAKAPPPPLTITPLCATDKEYLWTVTSDAPGLAQSPSIDYTTKKTDDWSWPNGSYAFLSPSPDGAHRTVVFTSRADGVSLYVRWTDFPTVIVSTSTAPTATCAMATLTIRRVVQGGAAAVGQFPVDVIRQVDAFANPASDVTVTPVTSDAPVAVPPSGYMVGPKKEGLKYVALPAGYAWQSTACGNTTDATGAVVVGGGSTTDQRARRMVLPLLPGYTVACTVTYHYGPLLYDLIAAGRKGADSSVWDFDTSGPDWPLTVKKGTYVTYLVTTSPSLAGKKVQIWMKTGSASKPWKLTKTVTVASDGTVRYYAKVTAYTGFQARWAGDKTYPAVRSEGRFVTVK